MTDLQEVIPTQYQLSHYRYQLPPELIAHAPAPQRHESRLLIAGYATKRIEHARFHDLPSLLKRGDVLVANETKVVKAVIPCRKATGAYIELLVVNPFGFGQSQNKRTIRTCITKTSKGLKAGAHLDLEDGTSLRILSHSGKGRIDVLFPIPEHDFLQFLEAYGKTPLPPYIKSSQDELTTSKRYQTVYSANPGSIAAPTAGLHFTDELLHTLRDVGVELSKITLHVGPGTFIPVRNEDIRLHQMEQEEYFIGTDTAETINKASMEQRRIIAVGTTTTRALESATHSGMLAAGVGKTRLFIYPGYSYRLIRNMITNFHLPESTLLMLVCALAGTEFVKSVYETAINHRYRFYSYGDAGIFLNE